MIKRMRELVKLSVFLLGKIISSITGNITIGTNRMFSLFYTGYISRRFKSIGKGSVINYKPLQLHGLKFVEIGYKTIIKRTYQHIASTPTLFPLNSSRVVFLVTGSKSCNKPLIPIIYQQFSKITILL